MIMNLVIDVKSASLNEYLEEDIYMGQHFGFHF